MRNVFILLCALLFSYETIAQEAIDCGTSTEIVNLPPVYFSPFNNTGFSGSYDLEYLETFPQISFDIYFWIINRDGGVNDDGLTENDILISLSKVNELFKPMGICFVMKGYDNIDETDIYENVSYGTIFNYAHLHGKVIPNCFNVYLPKTFNGANGVTNYGWDKIVLKQGTLLGQYAWIRGVTLAHELAHDFGLMHTWGNNNTGDTTSEKVTRIPTNPYYNALTTADKIHDTPAMINFKKEAELNGVPLTAIIDYVTCEYLGNMTDNLNIPFEITPADVGNPMGGTYQPCGTGFTVGQGIRIREYIDLNPNVPSVLAMRSNVCTNCFEDLIISTPVIVSESFKVENTITASSELNDNIQVIYAGEEIYLEPGFETGGGTGKFLAKVSPCDPDADRSSSRKITSNEKESEFPNETIELFYMYPNPANSIVTIAGVQEIQSILITAMDGKILFSDNFTGKLTNTEVVISNYTNGIYNVTITTVGGKRQTKKLIKS